MSKSKKPFVVRGFNLEVEGEDSVRTFDSTDVMTKFGSFTEVTADKQHEAVVEMTTHSVFRTMSARNLAKAQIPDDVKELYVVDLVIVTNLTDVTEVRPHRSLIRETLKLWAEKSRVRGRRGWRLNAIKTPTVEFDKKVGSVVIRTQMVLSTAILYDEDTMTLNVGFDPLMEQEDLRNLHRALVRNLGQTFNSLKYKHSEIGEGEII